MGATTRHSECTKNKNRLAFLDALRGVAIIMVVVVHSVSYSSNLPDEFKAVTLFITQMVAVPIFFLVDGYLLSRSAHHGKKKSILEYYKMSLMRLMMPWFLFSVLYLVLRIAAESAGIVGPVVTDNIVDFGDLVSSFVGSIAAPHLYFLFSLFLIRLFYPLFSKIVVLGNLGFYTILSFMIVLCVYFMPSVNEYLVVGVGEDPLVNAIWGVQFYSLGIMLYRYRVSRMLDNNAQYTCLLTLIFIVFLCSWIGFGRSQVFEQYLYLITIWAIFSSGIPAPHWLQSIGKSTMGIYLLHVPLLLFIVKFMLDGLNLAPIVHFLFLLLFTFALSYWVTRILERFKFSFFLFGIKNIASKGR